MASLNFNARFAWLNNGGWMVTDSYKKIVQHFLRTGQVTLQSSRSFLSDTHFPAEGFHAAAFDSNPSNLPTKDFGLLDPFYGEVDFGSVGKEEWVIELPPERSEFLTKCRMCIKYDNQKCGCVLMTKLYQLAKVTKGKKGTNQPAMPRGDAAVPFRDEPRARGSRKQKKKVQTRRERKGKM